MLAVKMYGGGPLQLSDRWEFSLYFGVFENIYVYAGGKAHIGTCPTTMHCERQIENFLPDLDSPGRK